MNSTTGSDRSNFKSFYHDFVWLKNIPGNKVPATIVFFFFFLRTRTISLLRGEHRWQSRILLFLASLSHPFPAFSKHQPTATLVTVWRLDFLLNSAGKKLRIRQGVTSLFPHLLIPRDSRLGPDCASPVTTVLRLGKIPLNFPGNSCAIDRPRNFSLGRCFFKLSFKNIFPSE